MLLTRRGNTLYVHLPRHPRGNRVQLKPNDVLPRRAVLLNTGQELEARVDLLPSNHVEKKAHLRVRGIPANALTNTVMVLKLEFDALPE